MTPAPSMPPAAALALLLAAAAPAGAQTLYKCVQGGRTVYQQEPCPQEARQSTVRAPDAPAVRPLDPREAEEKAVQTRSQQVDTVIDVVSGFALCTESVSGFGARYAPAFEDWKLRNIDALARFNEDPAARSRLDQKLQGARARPAGDDAGATRAELCSRVLAAIQPGRGAK